MNKIKILFKNIKTNFFKNKKGGLSAKISLSPSWLKKLGITENERDLTVSLDEENKKIIVEKKK